MSDSDSGASATRVSKLRRPVGNQDSRLRSKFEPSGGSALALVPTDRMLCSPARNPIQGNTKPGKRKSRGCAAAMGTQIFQKHPLPKQVRQRSLHLWG